MERTLANTLSSLNVSTLGSTQSARQFKAAASLRKAQPRLQQQVCSASMGIGFNVDDEYNTLATPSKNLVVPGHDYGLSAKQMQLLGLSNASRMQLPEIDAVS